MYINKFDLKLSRWLSSLNAKQIWSLTTNLVASLEHLLSWHTFSGTEYLNGVYILYDSRLLEQNFWDLCASSAYIDY